LSERSGVGAVQVAILEALAAWSGGGFRSNEKLLSEAEVKIGLAPWYAYPVLVDLAQPWKMPVTLVDGQGNFGSRGNDPAAGRRYTESRLTDAGRVVLAAERRDLAPVPVGLINGNTYRDGTRPPFRPLAVIEAIRHVMRHPKATSEEIVSIIGPPDFITGCTVSGDLAAFAAGHPTELRLQAKITISDDRQAVIVGNIPPNISTDDAVLSIAKRAEQTSDLSQPSPLHTATRLDLREVADESNSRTPDGRIVCKPAAGVPPEEVLDQLTRVYGVYTTMYVALPRSLPATIRQWVETNQGEDLATSLTSLENAILSQPNPRY
jgi:DNA gyrase/topoisomerase IV subunit A